MYAESILDEPQAEGKVLAAVFETRWLAAALLMTADLPHPPEVERVIPKMARLWNLPTPPPGCAIAAIEVADDVLRQWHAVFPYFHPLRPPGDVRGEGVPVEAGELKLKLKRRRVRGR